MGKKVSYLLKKETAEFAEVEDELKENPEIEKIVKIGNDETKTVYTILVMYKNPQNFPKTINFWGINKKVKQFIPQPVQCFKCQRFGHKSQECRSNQRCLLCAGLHAHSDCPRTEQNCANCKGKHPANANICPVKKEKKMKS